MIRVLHYVGKMDRGGMETFIMNLYRNINHSEIQFDFAIHGDRNGDFEEEILTMGGRFYQFPHMRKNPIAYRKAWRNFWREHRGEYRAFHMHTNSLANIIAMEEAYDADVPIRIIHSHSSYANKGKLQLLNDCIHKLHRKRIGVIATNLIACSNKAAEWMFGGMKLGKKNVVLLNNGIDIYKFKYCVEDRKRIREELAISDDIFLIGQVGAFLPVKNHNFSIDFFKKLKNENENVKLMLIGEGSLKNDIEHKVKENGLSEDVLFLGKRSDIECLLSSMDLFIMPSLYEGLPVSLVEAQANGVPTLASNTITKEVKFNDNLRYCSIDSGVSKWIEEIPKLGKEHVANIKEIVQRGFDIKDTCKKYMDILKV